MYGLNEGRSSSEFFNAVYYLQSNPDLLAAGLNYAQGLVHFLLYGLAEGRRGVPFGSRLAGREVYEAINVRAGVQTRLGQLEGGDAPNPTRPGSYRDDYYLTGVTPGQSITIDLSALNNSFNTYLQLIDAATGQVIAFDDDSGGLLNSWLTFRAVAGTNYIVRATSFNIW